MSHIASGKSGKLYRIHATKPGHLSDGKLSYQHSRDNQEVIDCCLVCKAYKCPGDCETRRMAAKVASKKGIQGVHKGIDPESITSRFDAGLEIIEISKALDVSQACVRYWLRKTGRKRAKA